MNLSLKPAIFNRTSKMIGSIEQTGEEHIAIIEIDGVQFRSWLPKSEAEARKINHVASVIIAKATPIAPEPEVVEW